MLKPPFSHIITALLLSLTLLFTGCSDEEPGDKSTEVSTAKAAEPVDVVARVDEEVITYGELNSMLNSSAMVGLTIPELGTPERNKMMLAMLDKLISANLVYLDAKDKGTDRLSSFKEDVHRFEDAILASMYKSMLAKGDTQVSELDVLHYYNTQTSREAELTDDTKLAIEAMIRKQKMDEFEVNLRSRLREDVDVVINEKVLNPDYDDKRSDADVVASYNNHRITWSQVKDMMLNANKNPSQANFYIDNFEERVTRLQQYIDNAIMALKGRAAGLENDAVYIERTSEYRKARLINEHRNGLIHNWNPSEDELKTYLADNMDNFSVPETRRVQMLVVKTQEEAESIKAQVDKGEMTLGQAAQQLSIDPNAKFTQGDMGWISKGTKYEGLETLIFQLEPEVVSDPVESGAGWHLLKVLAVVAAREQNLEDPQTRQRVFRAYMQDRLNNYIVDLRKNHFVVTVYQDELQRQFQREAEFIADLKSKAQPDGFVTEQHIEEIQQSITQPSAE